MTPAHDEPLEEQAARAQTNTGYARNGTLFPQVYRAAAPPFASKKFAFHGFFFLKDLQRLLHLSTDGVTLAQLEARIALIRTSLIVAPDSTSPYPTCPGNRELEDSPCFDGQFSCYIELPCKRCVGLQAPHPTNISFGTTASP